MYFICVSKRAGLTFIREPSSVHLKVCAMLPAQKRHCKQNYLRLRNKRVTGEGRRLKELVSIIQEPFKRDSTAGLLHLLMILAITGFSYA